MKLACKSKHVKVKCPDNYFQFRFLSDHKKAFYYKWFENMHTTLILLTTSKAIIEHGFSSRVSRILKRTTNEALKVDEGHNFKNIKAFLGLTAVHLDISGVRRGHFKKLASVKTTSKLLESADEKEVGNH